MTTCACNDTIDSTCIAKALLNEAIDLAHQLLSLFENETAVLQSTKYDKLAIISAEKSRVATAYRYKLEDIGGTLVSHEMHHLVHDLSIINNNVMAAARNNAAALLGAMDANQRLIKMITDACIKKNNKNRIGYNRNGGHLARTRHESINPSIITRYL